MPATILGPPQPVTIVIITVSCHSTFTEVLSGHTRRCAVRAVQQEGQGVKRRDLHLGSTFPVRGLHATPGRRGMGRPPASRADGVKFCRSHCPHRRTASVSGGPALVKVTFMDS